MILESGLGNGKLAGVDEDNRVLTAAFNIPFNHLIAKDYQKVFVVEGNASPSPGDVAVLHVKNNSSSNVMVLSKLFVQAVTVAGGTALPNSSNYFSLKTGLSYSSGGLSTPVVNTTSGSAITSNVLAYDSSPTLSGSGNVVARYYPLNAAPFLLESEGAITVLPQQTLTLDYTGDHTSGFIYAAMSFAMVSGDGYSG